MKWKKFYQPDTIYFFTSRITENLQILRTDDFKLILVNSLGKYLDKYRVYLHGYVIMDNYFHLLISAPTAEGVKLCIQQTRSDSSYKISRKLESFLETQFASEAQSALQIFAKHANENSYYAVWKEQARGVPISSSTGFKTKLDYIHDNPVKAKLVSKPLTYHFSSSMTISQCEPGMLPIKPPVF